MHACECPRLGGELSLVLRGWRREFALLSYSRMYCSKRNLKELDKVTKREKKTQKDVFKTPCLESMSQLHSFCLSSHSQVIITYPHFSFPIEEQNERNVYCYKKHNAIIRLRKQVTEC